MSVYSFTYTLHHVLLLKLLSAFNFDRQRTMHNFLFLATASSQPSERSCIRYDFYKGTTGVHSFEVQSIISDLDKNDLLQSERFALSREGREFYYQVASLLRYERFPEHCMRVALRYQDNLWRINHEVLFNPLFRKAKTGRKIVLPVI
ncbi:MAG: hypothetical protein KGZ79_02110 [Dethiobacter sp.]|jgi:hypothetical protein|nr:hypothetical protein [Dethiobacter sp.]